MTKFLNNKNKTITIIFAFLITILLSSSLFSYSLIGEIQEKMNKRNIELDSKIQDLDEVLEGLQDDIDSINSKNNELQTVLEDQNESIIELDIQTEILNNANSILSDQIDELKKTNTQQQELIEEQEQRIQNLATQDYDYLIFSKNITNIKVFVAKSGQTGKEHSFSNFSEALQFAFSNGTIVKIKTGIYELNSEIILQNKTNIILDGQGATLNLNNHIISLQGKNYVYNKNNQIENLIIKNGTLQLQDCFMTTLNNLIFEDCQSATEIININNWSEYTKIENTYWNNCQTSLTFKIPTGNATGSYENTALDRCSFDLYGNNSIAITVEKDAQVSNSQWTNLRIWMHTHQNETQTGLYMNGASTDTRLMGVTFEGFGSGTNYGIVIGPDSSTGISVGEEVNFLANIIKIRNPDGRWLTGDATLFQQEITMNFTNSTNKNVTINREPEALNIVNFNGFIKVENLSPAETIIVDIILNFIDHTTSQPFQLLFNQNTTYWLTQDDLYQLYPSQNIIWNIKIKTQTNLLQSQTKVTFGIFGNLK